MRVALRQEPQECADRLNSVDGSRPSRSASRRAIAAARRGIRRDARPASPASSPPRNCPAAAPGCIARERPERTSPRCARAGRHNLRDDRALAMPPDAENYGFIAPLHEKGIHPPPKPEQAKKRARFRALSGAAETNCSLSATLAVRRKSIVVFCRIATPFNAGCEALRRASSRMTVSRNNSTMCVSGNRASRLMQLCAAWPSPPRWRAA